jgi:ABC-2 type transport system ATP-binding protein
VKGLTELGTTVFLTTHYMEEAQQLADRVAIIVGGRIVAEGTPATLGGRQLRDTTVSFAQVVLPSHLASRFTADGHRWVTSTPDPTELLHELTAWAVGAGVTLDGLEVTRPDLEDVYLELTGEGS